MAAPLKLLVLFLSLFAMNQWSKGKCLVDAFTTVFTAEQYQGRWIPDHYVASIIRPVEYKIPENKVLDGSDVKTAWVWRRAGKSI
jgi:hypothetical protein